MKKKIYISGQITGLTRLVAEIKFAAAERYLESQGYQPVNPFRFPWANEDLTWTEFLLHDLKELVQCQGIYMLNNWEQSKGARLEREVAVQIKLEVQYEPGMRRCNPVIWL